MTRSERIFAVLAATGLVVPYALLGAFLSDHGLDPAAFLRACFASVPAAVAATDLSLSFAAFAVWAIGDNRRRGVSAWWLPIPASLFVGLCFALPLHFLLRERRHRNSPTPAGAVATPARP